MWQTLEPVHAVVYFAPEARDAYARAGLKGGWMGYFASRSAAFGAAPEELVIATFYNFHPDMVRRAIPDAWTFSTPERVLDARLSVVDAALRRLMGSEVEGDAIGEAATLARRAAEACDPGGRALHAAHASLPWPEPVHLRLWHAATLLREHRGDGHVATLVAEGIDGCEAHVMLVAAGGSSAEMQRQYRGWSEEEWAAAEQRLAARGLVDAGGGFTEAGRRLRAEIETRTDELALAPYAALGERDGARLEALVRAVGDALSGSTIPYPNPMGLRPPA
jgi:hypothetical protein